MDNFLSKSLDAASGRGNRLLCRKWKVNEFASSESEWQDLLGRSNANPLFNSWIWQWTWWKNYQTTLQSELSVFAAYTADGRLVGVAPLHLRRASHRKYIAANRLELLGSAFRVAGGVFSEYQDFIVDRSFVFPFQRALAELLISYGNWSDFVVENSKVDSIAVQFVNEFLSDVCYVRNVGDLSAYQITLPENFNDYLQQIPAGVRRKLWNHRRKVSQVTHERCDISDLDAFLSEMDDLHITRWGKPHFVGVRGAFHRELAGELESRGALFLSRLRSEHGTLSMMYDICVDGTQYNIQSAFNAEHSKGISSGYMHFGYSIEKACGRGMTTFDFLAGSGRSSDYKRDFATRELKVISVQSIRSRPLAWLYQQYDRKLFGIAGTYLPVIGTIVDHQLHSFA